MICDITNQLEANPGLMLSKHYCYVETWNLQFTWNENVVFFLIREVHLKDFNVLI